MEISDNVVGFWPAIRYVAHFIPQMHEGDQDGIVVGLLQGLGVGLSCCQIKTGVTQLGDADSSLDEDDVDSTVLQG